ncbi:MAG: hypothetical protein EYC62_02290 [Alphaproteobacteria bacterium]|nr:MAG: hypothetical protein EYC62_02290 [Alphaproteobacteria bacterium]
MVFAQTENPAAAEKKSVEAKAEENAKSGGNQIAETKAPLSQDVCTLPESLCGDKPKFGTYWNSLSDSERKIMLQGFDIGQTSAGQTSYLEGQEAGNIRAGILDRRMNIGETYAGVGIELFVDYFNKLYADAANNSIDWSYAWMLASLSFQNETTESGDNDELLLKKFLQTYGELPGWVRIVDVKDVNVIEVEVLVPEPYRLSVRLRGVSLKGGEGKILTEDQKQRGIKFIRALAATRGYPFENCNCTEMVRPQLFYGSNLFSADGMLEAYVQINEANFCLLKDQVKATDFQPGKIDDGFVLNEAILEAGLAYMDEESSDYVESDKLMQNIDVAKDRGLNIYGKKTIPAIERMIKQGPKPVNQNCVP